MSHVVSRKKHLAAAGVQRADAGSDDDHSSSHHRRQRSQLGASVPANVDAHAATTAAAAAAPAGGTNKVNYRSFVGHHGAEHLHEGATAAPKQNRHVPGLHYRKLDSNQDLESSLAESYMHDADDEAYDDNSVSDFGHTDVDGENKDVRATDNNGHNTTATNNTNWDNAGDDDDDSSSLMVRMLSDTSSHNANANAMVGRRIMATGNTVWFRLRRNVSSLRMDDAWELLFAVAVFMACELLTRTIQANFHWQRPIPYQKLSNGDVVLDPQLSYPKLPNTVTPKQLTQIAVIFPILTVLCVGFGFGPIHDAKAGLCAILVGHGLTFFVSHTLKFYVGRFRPNFYDMCKFNKETLQCDAPASTIRSASHSFPSGHSAESFCGLVIVSLYFMGKIGLYSSFHQHSKSHRSRHRQRQQQQQPVASSVTLHGHRWQRHMFHLRQRFFMILAFVPIIVAMLIAGSRIHDFWHHPADVLAGSLIGGVCGWFAYSLWYPPVWDTRFPGIPYQTIEEQQHPHRAV